jgi:hypothetical protein
VNRRSKTSITNPTCRTRSPSNVFTSPATAARRLQESIEARWLARVRTDRALADPTAILATQPIVENAEVARVVSEGGYKTSSRQMSLRGVSEAFTIYEIRERDPAAAEA